MDKYPKVLPWIIGSLAAMTILFFVWEFDSNLPPGDHRQLVVDACLRCHSSDVLLKQRRSREEWQKVLSWMEDYHQMRKLLPHERDKILAYLCDVVNETIQPEK